MEKSIMKKFNRKNKGFTLIEILVACAIVIALSVGAFFGYQQAQQTRKIAQMHADMEAIASGCLAYEAVNIEAEPPATIADLYTGLTAANSIDGVAHEKFITSSKNGATTEPSDPWGNKYTYSQSARTITCIPYDGSGAAMTEIVRYF